MTYSLISLGFLVTAALIAAFVARRHRTRPLVMVVTLIVMLALTAVFDNLMIAAGLFTYAPEHISGLSIGLAPIEDFAYPLAVVLIAPALWMLLTSRRDRFAGELLRHAVICSRPVSWINTAFPFAAAMILTTGRIDAIVVIGTLYYLVAYNLAMYGINDVFDYASDLANPRKGGVEGGLLPPAFHRPLLWLVAAVNIPFLIVLVAVGSPESWIAIAISTFAVIAYSAPPFRLKERPGWDSATSSAHFVTPAIVGLTLAGARWDAGLILVLAAFFLWGMAAHAFGAVQDILPDRSAGIGSIATALGARATVRVALALWALAGVLVLFAPWPAPLAAVIAVPYLVNCGVWFRVSDQTSPATNRAWRRFLVLNYLSGFVVTLIMIYFWSLTS